jgi:hypothetical protein
MQKEFNKTQFYTVAVEIKANGRLTVIDQNSPLSGASIVSVRTRRTKTGAKTLQGKSLVNDANFDAAFLILKKDTTTEVIKVPLWHVEQASLQNPSEGFPIYANNLNFSACLIEIVETVTLDTGNCVELTFEFWEKKK